MIEIEEGMREKKTERQIQTDRDKETERGRERERMTEIEGKQERDSKVNKLPRLPDVSTPLDVCQFSSPMIHNCAS